MDHGAMRAAIQEIIAAYHVRLHMRRDMQRDLMRVAEKHAEYVRIVTEESFTDSLV